MTTLLILVVAVAITFFLSAIFLQLAARLLRSPRATFGRSLLATVLMTLLSMVLQGLTYMLARGSPEAALVSIVAVGIGAIVGACFIIQWIFETSFLKAAGTWLLSQVGTVAIILLTLFVFRPFVLEAWITSANSMAPTILGEHFTACCPHCGSSSIVPQSEVERKDYQEVIESEPGYLAICSRCYRTSRVDEMSDQLLPPDRFIANKLLSPRRWDLVVFKTPENPEVTYVKRLVGLPGETVFIRDGKIWVNNEPLPFPKGLEGLHYVTNLEGIEVELGTPENPWHLADNEYCMLGDFSELAVDSRFWGPVPEENLIGVVTVLYWPLSRWTIWR
jgi:signal peptidase I